MNALSCAVKLQTAPMSLAPMQNACCCFYNLLNNLLVKYEKDITERLYTVMKCILVFIGIIFGVKSWGELVFSSHKVLI
jgi:hypothetical protein